MIAAAQYMETSLFKEYWEKCAAQHADTRMAENGRYLREGRQSTVETFTRSFSRKRVGTLGLRSPHSTRAREDCVAHLSFRFPQS